MEIGIGLPATIPGVDGKTLTDWARRAEERGFTTLGTIDRLVYPNFEPLLSLAAAAAVTERIRLMTSVILMPLRTNPALLAKEVLTLDNISGGRFMLGAGLGGREDDYEVSGVDTGTRGKRIDEQLAEIRRIWLDQDGENAIGPRPVSDEPPIIVGGSVEASFRRAAEHGRGWIMGGGTPEQLADSREKVREAWSEADREGEPRIMGLAYYALGSDAEEHAERYLGHYYGYLGEDVAGSIVSSAATDADTVREYLKGFEEAGCDELIMFPCAAELEQVDLLAEAAPVEAATV